MAVKVKSCSRGDDGRVQLAALECSSRRERGPAKLRLLLVESMNQVFDAANRARDRSNQTLLILCVPAAPAAVEIRPNRPWTIIDFEVRVALEFRRILAELLPNRVAERVLYIVDSIVIVTDVVGSKPFDLGDPAFNFVIVVSISATVLNRVISGGCGGCADRRGAIRLLHNWWSISSTITSRPTRLVDMLPDSQLRAAKTFARKEPVERNENTSRG
jgi:hypothetical protein